MRIVLYSVDRRRFCSSKRHGKERRTLGQFLDQLLIASTSKRHGEAPSTLGQFLDHFLFEWTSKRHGNEPRTLGQFLDQFLIESMSKRHDECKKSLAFHAELNKTKFTIFAPLADYGNFGWNPDKKMSKLLSAVKSSNEIVDHIDLQRKPPKLVPMSELRFPQQFFSYLPSEKFSSLYPYGQYYVASLYVATRHRGVSLKEIDFVFGGSTLQMLAQRPASGSSSYMATRIPSAENTILVVKSIKYIHDVSGVGYQFERFVTGFPMDCPSERVMFSEHLHTMRIDDKYDVLFCAETDAIDDCGDPVEVTVSKLQSWGTKFVFQMISIGCPTLCHGSNVSGNLSNAKIVHLSSLVDDTMTDMKYSRFQDNITSGMKALKDQMMDKKAGDVFSISFDIHGALKLTPSMTSSSVLLPSTKLSKS